MIRLRPHLKFDRSRQVPRPRPVPVARSPSINPPTRGRFRPGLGLADADHSGSLRPTREPTHIKILPAYGHSNGLAAAHRNTFEPARHHAHTVSTPPSQKIAVFKGATSEPPTSEPSPATASSSTLDRPLIKSLGTAIRRAASSTVPCRRMRPKRPRLNNLLKAREVTHRQPRPPRVDHRPARLTGEVRRPPDRPDRSRPGPRRPARDGARGFRGQAGVAARSVRTGAGFASCHRARLAAHTAALKSCSLPPFRPLPPWKAFT